MQNSLYDVIEEWDLNLDPDPKIKKNPKRGIEFRPDIELNYNPQSQEGKVMVVTTDATYYVRPKNLEKFLEKLKARQESLKNEEEERRLRWLALEEASEPKPVVVKEKPKAPDYSDIEIQYYSTKNLRVAISGMTEREKRAYLQHYRKKNNRAAVKVCLEALPEGPKKG